MGKLARDQMAPDLRKTILILLIDKGILTCFQIDQLLMDMHS